MKRTYVQPLMRGEAFTANQAVAACQIPQIEYVMECEFYKVKEAIKDRNDLPAQVEELLDRAHVCDGTVESAIPALPIGNSGYYFMVTTNPPELHLSTRQAKTTIVNASN